MGIVVGLSIAVVIGLIVLLGVMSYLKAPPNMAFVVSGLKKEPRYIIGTNGWRIPFLERLDKLYLGVIGVDVKTREPVPTAEYVDVFVDANVNIKIGSTGELMNRAAKNFLNQKQTDIAAKAQQVLEGNVREIIGQMELTQLVSDRQAFAEKVLQNVTPDMNKLGLEVVSFNVQNFSDPNGVIANLGVDNVEKIKKNAAIAKSDALREVAEREAENQRKANEAQVAAAKEIAEQNNALDMRASELKEAAEIKKAAAEMAYSIREADEKKKLEVALTQAKIAQMDEEVKLQAQKIELKEKELDALVRKEADAKLYATQRAAEADLFERERQAEAAKIEAEKKAEAEKALAEAMKVKALAEAEGVRAKGLAEAEAIRAQAEAEAKGMLEKAEALKQYGDAAKQQMELDAVKVLYEQLPAIAEAIGKGYAGADIHLIGNDSGQLAGNMMGNITQIIEGFKGATGVDPMSVLSGMMGAKLAEKSVE